MRKYSLVTAVLLVGILVPAYVVTSSRARAIDTAFLAQLKVGAESLHSFGDLRQGQEAKHVFTIENKSRQPIEILAAKTSCRCTVPGDAPKFVAARSTAEVEVSLNTSGIVGLANSNVILDCGDAGSFILRLTANVAKEMPGVVEFGDREKGAEVQQTFLLEPVFGSELEIHELKYDRKFFDVGFHKLPGGEKAAFEFNVTLLPSADFGAYRKPLAIVTNDPINPEKTIEIKGVILDRVVAEPRAVAFGIVPAGQEVKSKVHFYSPYKEDVEIVDLVLSEKSPVAWKQLAMQKEKMSVDIEVSIQAPNEVLEDEIYKEECTVRALVGGEEQTLKLVIYGLFTPE